MLNNKKKKSAFTLTELLIALAIIGAIAAMAIPSLVNNLQRKILSTSLKNLTTELYQLINNQMISNRAKNLSDTDFATASTLLSGSNFEFAKTCSGITSCFGATYKDLAKTSYTVANLTNNASSAILLKNGVALAYSGSSSSYNNLNLPTKVALGSNFNLANTTLYVTTIVIEAMNNSNAAYADPPTTAPSTTPPTTPPTSSSTDTSSSTSSTTSDSDSIIGTFYVDVNGTDKPNIIGRDFFTIAVTQKGHLTNTSKSDDDNSENLTNCKAGNSSLCFSYLLNNNWNMDY